MHVCSRLPLYNWLFGFSALSPTLLPHWRKTKRRDFFFFFSHFQFHLNECFNTLLACGWITKLVQEKLFLIVINIQKSQTICFQITGMPSLSFSIIYALGGGSSRAAWCCEHNELVSDDYPAAKNWSTCIDGSCGIRGGWPLTSWTLLSCRCLVLQMCVLIMIKSTLLHLK